MKYHTERIEKIQVASSTMRVELFYGRANSIVHVSSKFLFKLMEHEMK
jgi:hypothetical protein